MDKTLSILICSLVKREKQFKGLLDSLYAQIKYLENPEEVEVLYLVDEGELSVGAKRNKLLSMASGKYTVFIDDDDRVSGDYVFQILEATKTSPDAIGITGIITWDLKNPKMFRHSMDYGKECPTIDNVFNKPPYHICPIKADIAKAHEFPDLSYGEDSKWSMECFPSIKTCVTIPVPIYLYDFRFKGSETQAKANPINPVPVAPVKPVPSKRGPIRPPQLPQAIRVRPTAQQPPGKSRHFENGVLKRY